MELLTLKQINYFKSKLVRNDNGCEIFTGCINRRGYGKLCFCIRNTKTYILAHRLAMFLHTGLNPKKLHVLHKPLICHNKACCNKEHLYFGTQKHNRADMKLDGTILSGEKNPSAKLTLEKVAEIRILLADNENSAEIAAAYDISRRQIDRIKNNENWKI